MYCINYVIQNGDTLYSISRQFNIGLNTIIEANPLMNVYNLRVGETICIPVSVPSNQYTQVTTYTVREGDTLGSILENNAVSLADLMQRNPLNEIFLLPGSVIQIPVAAQIQE
jgi:LysM repeat protein